MFDFHQTVSDRHGEQSEDRVQAYIEGLMAEFASSAEATGVREPFGGVHWAEQMLEFAFNYLGVSPAGMTRRDIDEVVFDLFPRKVAVDPDQAESIITQLRAFWTFVSRQYGSANAKTILAALDGRATDRLRKSLADPSNFGMAKSFLMMGSQSGFDMTSPDGLAAFQATYNAKLQAGPVPPLPHGNDRIEHTPRPNTDAVKKKRKAKKQQRDAKKRNRPR